MTESRVEGARGNWPATYSACSMPPPSDTGVQMAQSTPLAMVGANDESKPGASGSHTCRAVWNNSRTARPTRRLDGRNSAPPGTMPRCLTRRTACALRPEHHEGRRVGQPQPLEEHVEHAVFERILVARAADQVGQVGQGVEPRLRVEERHLL